jgi:hypothetical protein
MTLLEYHEKGIIKDLFNKGIISINHITYFRYYEVWEAYRKQGYSKNKSYKFASDECGRCESTIRKAVRIINQ